MLRVQTDTIYEVHDKFVAHFNDYTHLHISLEEAKEDERDIYSDVIIAINESCKHSAYVMTFDIGETDVAPPQITLHLAYIAGLVFNAGEEYYFDSDLHIIFEDANEAMIFKMKLGAKYKVYLRKWELTKEEEE